MSQEATQTTANVTKLSDTSIGMIRDLIQLSLLLGVNIIDNLRAMRFETDATTGALLPTAAYVTAYNQMLQTLEAQVNASIEKAQQTGEIPGDSATEEALVVAQEDKN